MIRQIRIPQIFSSWLLCLLTALAAQGIEPNADQAEDLRVQKMVEYLRKIQVFAPVPYKQLSELTCLGRVHIDRLFKQHLKITPKGFLAQALLSQCTQQILIQDKIFKGIAREMGFNSEAQFCTWFNKRTGLTPLQFRCILGNPRTFNVLTFRCFGSGS